MVADFSFALFFGASYRRPLSFCIRSLSGSELGKRRDRFDPFAQKLHIAIPVVDLALYHYDLVLLPDIWIFFE